MTKIVAYNENESKKKNHAASSVMQISRDASPIKELGTLIWMVTKTGNVPTLALQTQHQQKPNTKIKEKGQKWSREEYKETLYYFYYAFENPSKTCTTERTYKLWPERNKTEREYIDV